MLLCHSSESESENNTPTTPITRNSKTPERVRVRSTRRLLFGRAISVSFSYEAPNLDFCAKILVSWENLLLVGEPFETRLALILDGFGYRRARGIIKLAFFFEICLLLPKKESDCRSLFFFHKIA